MKDQFPDLKNPLPMPAVKSPKTEAISTNEIEKTKRALYGCLDRIRRAGKHRKLTAEFEERLEEHLEVLRLHENNLSRNCLAHLETAGQMRQERDQIQQRLHAIDHAYLEQSQRNGEQARQIEKLEEIAMIAGEELIAAQESSRKHAGEADKTRKQLSDAMVLVRRQRAAIGHLFMRLTEQKEQTNKPGPICKFCQDTGFITIGVCSSWCACTTGKIAWSNSQ